MFTIAVISIQMEETIKNNIAPIEHATNFPCDQFSGDQFSKRRIICDEYSVNGAYTVSTYMLRREIPHFLVFHCIIHQWTIQLKHYYCNRFKDFEHISVALNFLQDPFQIPLSKAKDLAEIFSVDCVRLEIDLIDLQSSPTESILDWRNVTQSYIRLLAAKIVYIFSSHILVK